MANKSKLIFILSIVLMNIGCKKNEKNCELIPIHRYEKALLSIPKDNLREGIAAIQDSFPLFLEGANLTDSVNILRISNFINDPLIQESYLKIDRKFGDFSELQKQISFLFKNYITLFPEEKIPVVNTYISNFDYENRIIYVDSVIAISLDMYLGENEPNYTAVGIPHYLSRRLSPEYIQVDIAKIVGLDKIPFAERKNLLDELVYRGKMLYITDLLLPDVSDELKIGYTSEQLQWCKDNALSIWQYLIQEQLLYETNYIKIKQYLNDGPGNVPFEGSPARLSEWIGWQIVRKYAKKHTDLNTLLHEKEAQIILKESGYKGK